MIDIMATVDRVRALAAQELPKLFEAKGLQPLEVVDRPPDAAVEDHVLGIYLEGDTFQLDPRDKDALTHVVFDGYVDDVREDSPLPASYLSVTIDWMLTREFGVEGYPLQGMTARIDAGDTGNAFGVLMDIVINLLHDNMFR